MNSIQVLMLVLFMLRMLLLKWGERLEIIAIQDHCNSINLPYTGNNFRFFDWQDKVSAIQDSPEFGPELRHVIAGGLMVEPATNKE